MADWTGVPFDLGPLRATVPDRPKAVCLYLGRDEQDPDMHLDSHWQVLVNHEPDPDI